MPSAEPKRLADDLWLAAHDSVDGKSWVGAWPLGVGLATGLLAELGQDGFLQLRQGEMFRTAVPPPSDPALRPLLLTMEAEEHDQPPPLPPTLPPTMLPSARARTGVPLQAAGGRDRHAQTSGPSWPAQVQGPRWPVQSPDGPAGARPAAGGRDWPAVMDDGRSRRLSRVQAETRHRQHGHQLSTWLSYLAYDRRAEERVVDRLSRTGLVRRVQRRRLLGGTTVTYVPYDSVVSGTPASSISHAVQTRRGLDQSQLLLAGLFLATGLHHQALAYLTPVERSYLADELKHGLDDMSRELLRAADAAVGEAAMR